MNGATAPPELPADVMNASAVFCEDRGSMRSVAVVAHAYMGPRR